VSVPYFQDLSEYLSLNQQSFSQNGAWGMLLPCCAEKITIPSYPHTGVRVCN
jgi:hypothetical protein